MNYQILTAVVLICIILISGCNKRNKDTIDTGYHNEELQHGILIYNNSKTDDCSIKILDFVRDDTADRNIIISQNYFNCSGEIYLDFNNSKRLYIGQNIINKNLSITNSEYVIFKFNKVNEPLIFDNLQREIPEPEGGYYARFYNCTLQWSNSTILISKEKLEKIDSIKCEGYVLEIRN